MKHGANGDSSAGCARSTSSRAHFASAAVGIVLAAAVGYTVHTVAGVSVLVERMVDMRTPVALISTELVGDVYSTLAALRGYLQSGNPQFKIDRAATWK